MYAVYLRLLQETKLRKQTLHTKGDVKQKGQSRNSKAEFSFKKKKISLEGVFSKAPVFVP